MLDNTISLNNILVSLEGVLKLEASGELKVDEILNSAISRLENAYNCTFDRDVWALQADNQLTADNINRLLKDIKQCLEQLSLYINLKLYHKNPSVALSDVNYLGYAKTQLMSCLKYLQDAELSKQYRSTIIPPLHNTLNNIPMCTTKRLFIALMMLDKLGIDEGVSVVSQLLYIGGLVS